MKLSPDIAACLIKGHFELSSKLHSSVYIQTAPLFERNDSREALARSLLQEVMSVVPIQTVDTVLAMAHGATVLGCEVARQTDKRFLFMEGGKLRRAQRLSIGERVLIVEDVSTTGGTVDRAVEELIHLGVTVVCAASLICRHQEVRKIIPRVAAYKFDLPLYDGTECPGCADGQVLERYASRKKGV